jgi:LPXTG-site transpeptidase (sortase) family protein
MATLSRKAKERLIFLGIFITLSIGIFGLLNAAAFARTLRYDLLLHSPFASEDLKQGDILEVGSGTPGGVAFTVTSTAQLAIPAIGVVTPIVPPKGTAKKDILAAMEEGVALYPGSVGPGEQGRVVMLGHSSRASWYRGNYATVFSLLSKLEGGQEFVVAAQGKKYIYQIFRTSTLSPSDTNALLAGPFMESEIDLITCYPVGGASKRTVVQARLIRTETL